jgi:hypothetical protein
MTGRALKGAETVDGALVPTLTAWDKRVLNAVPAGYEPGDRGWSPAARGLDPWMIARTLRVDDVGDVRRTLRGLSDRRLVATVGYDTPRRYQRWVRVGC